MFRLTKQEQRIIAFVLVVVVIGCAVRYWRLAHRESKAQPEVPLVRPE